MTTANIQPDPTHTTAMARRAKWGSFIGTAIEWYDFYLYGTAAALVFNQVFFTDFDGPTGTLLSLMTFSAGFIARPVGGIVMGHFGDRIGRKSMLVLSLMTMGIATTLIGFLPTYATIGIWAPLLLVLLRVIQGFGVGGEWGGAVLVAVEHAPKTKKGLAGSWPQVGVPVGLFMANAVFMIMNFIIGPEEFVAWGWRVGFLGSALLIAVGLIIRLKMEETPDFAEVKETAQVAKFPIAEMFRTQWRRLLLAAGVKISQNAIFYIITVFVLTYVGESLGMSDDVALVGVMIACVISVFSLMFFGWISDQFGRRRTYLFGAIASAVFAYPMFALMDTRNVVLIAVAIVLAFIFHDAMYGPQASFMTEMFETKVRYTGTSLGYQFASTIAGAVSPVLAVYLLQVGNDRPWLVALYMIGVSIVTIVATILSPETHRGNRRKPAKIDRIADKDSGQPYRPVSEAHTSQPADAKVPETP
ncbi:MFS transporter [Brevibacterium sp. SMBL_HHYL_HB1]|jgi:MHS family shikimate/dehydroshikimate transporter-like MFS transporter|uniref:MFS transporter n=1 Tax=Brevibacterium sp. SMBL_HHYL_HB1 TaxID=2777556 RepID=UPI001BAC200C|nr:MFS transporter [Brevibacterium sp. SMBL_HHYL_HB1]QUL78034.1 MHS family MFS transporter [Brevibacterium sp. SMBL_HHYL_HB1]